jgi:hypothetical protein
MHERRDNYAINHIFLILYCASCTETCVLLFILFFVLTLSLLFFPDLQFPIDLSCVEKDHPFLEKDQLQALYRRLVVLNRSAAMRLDGQYNRNVNVCKIFSISSDISLSIFLTSRHLCALAARRGACWLIFVDPMLMIDDSN